MLRTLDSANAGPTPISSPYSNFTGQSRPKFPILKEAGSICLYPTCPYFVTRATAPRLGPTPISNLKISTRSNTLFTGHKRICFKIDGDSFFS